MECDICHEPIEDSFFELPDGMIVCTDSDCLEEWAKAYLMPGRRYVRLERKRK